MADDFKSCSVDGCNGNAAPRADGRRGLCSKHYRRMVAHGDPLAGRVQNGEPLRFLHEVAFGYEGDDCLLWPFGKSNNGYGTIHVVAVGEHRQRKHFVHRLVCEHVHGPAPKNADAAHSCGNRDCINPLHLRWASRTENMDDARAHGTILGLRAKLTPADIPSIRAALATGRSVASIAAEFGVSDGCIYSIARGTNWKWVPSALAIRSSSGR
jgi:hypothetical protein